MKKIMLLVICLNVWLLMPAQTTEPILRLNTEMHTAAIDRISTDAQGRFILTVSRDKTARLWDAATGSWLQTFRPPIGDGYEGMLHAGALSPDANIAAVAGWTGYEWDTVNSIYFFNTTTGKMVNRISGFESAILDLEFSPDGKYLVTALDEGGISIFEKRQTDPNDFVKYKILAGYNDASNNITFNHIGNLATVCNDGYIRLYSSSFELLKQKKGVGNLPISITFSPEGSKIAVGYADTTEVEVLDASTLQHRYSSLMGDMETTGGQSIVSFSSTGEFLWGGGRFQKSRNGRWSFILRFWNQAGAGEYFDNIGGGNTIRDIKPISKSIFYKEDCILFCSARPEFGVMDITGRKWINRVGEVYLMAERNNQCLNISTDGKVVAFKPIGEDTLTFSISERQFLPYEVQTAMENYHDQIGKIIVSDWEDSYNPLINGNKMEFLWKNEKCTSVDISLSGNLAVLGTNWTIYCFNEMGEMLWKTPIQYLAHDVNISPNGKVIAASLQNGTINWFSMKNGELLLTLYVHPSDKRWVLFTPGGFYDASPGAEDLIGWHLNNGPDKEAYFFPASKFRDKYYFPEVIDNILITCDEKEAVRMVILDFTRKTKAARLEDVLPPIAKIISPSFNQEITTEQLTISYTTVSPGGEPVTAIKTMIDGRPVENQRGFQSKIPNNEEVVISMPPRDATIQLLAENMHGWSTPAEVRLKWKGKTQEDILKPTLYLLAIGVSDYQNNNMDLKYAAKDASDFTQTMQLQKGGLYKDVKAKLLTDAAATNDEILEGFDWIVSETTHRDVAIIFLAGHGVNDNQGTFYFLPYEADLESLRRTGLMFTEFKYTTSSIAGKVIAFVDACHSGNVMGGKRAPDVNSLVNELTDTESGAVVFTSSTGKQFSLESDEWKNGAFTKAIVEGMNGKADLFGKEKITVKSLDAWVAERVKELTEGKQTPTAVIPESIPDFPIGIIK